MAERSPDADPRLGSAPASDVTRFVSEATGRIQEIIDSAERVAGQIRADAEAEARTYLDERRRAADEVVNEQRELLAALAQELSDHAADLRISSAQIVSALEGAAARLRAAPPSVTAATPEAAPAPAPPSVTAATPEAAPAPAAPTAPEGEPLRPDPQAVPGPSLPPSAVEGPDAAILRATQLAVAGSGRSEIEAALRRDFGLDEPADILDRILGPED